MDLYRVMPFSRLKEIAEQASLAFVTRHMFDLDPHEAPLIQALTTRDGLEDVKRVLAEDGASLFDVMALIHAARDADRTAFIQCWTRSPEHNLMWASYGKGDDAVRVTMDESAQSNLPGYVSFYQARYEDCFDIRKELQLVRPSHGSFSTVDFSQSFTFKLKAYWHESEVRLMTPIVTDFVFPEARRSPNPWGRHPEGKNNVLLVPIGDIKKIVTSVMTGPRASAELQRDVAEFCSAHGLAYEGQSILSTPKYNGSRKIFNSDPD